jgi:transposase-like protein
VPVAPPLIGTYTSPAVRVGQRVTCLFRDCDCKVTSISNAPIPWPRVQPVEERGGSGLWVCAALVKAIRTESAAALKYHFGASTTTVWAWRKNFGVGGRATTKGSKRAIRAAAKLGAEAVKAKEWTDEELDQKAATAKRLGLKPGPRWTAESGGWTEEQVALLGTDHDAVIAQKLGRTLGAVTSKRTQLKIRAFSGSPGGGRAWTEEEIALLGTDTDETIAARIGRTTGAVAQKRAALKVSTFCDRRRRAR